MRAHVRTALPADVQPQEDGQQPLDRVRQRRCRPGPSRATPVRAGVKVEVGGDGHAGVHLVEGVAGVVPVVVVAGAGGEEGLDVELHLMRVARVWSWMWMWG